MTIRLQRVLANAACAGALAGALAIGAVALAPGSTAQTCGPGFVPNPYNSQCLAPVTTPVINGVPCVASKLGLCSSFVQNQQPPRIPRAAAS
jgi:hypothetical protein